MDEFPEIFEESMIIKRQTSVQILLQLNNLELAVNLAKRGNLPGAENLVSGNLVFQCTDF